MRVSFAGQMFHLGSARGRLVNAVETASAFIAMLPKSESPQATDERHGFCCPYELSGNVGAVDLKILLRDFEEDGGPRRIEAIRAAAVERLHPGGTDGARLTEMGVPTPNIFDGGFNYHSVLEWAAVPAMVRATEVVLNLVRLWAGK